MDNTHSGFDTGFCGAGPLGITTTIDPDILLNLEGDRQFFDWEFNHWINAGMACVVEYRV
jgi:hypothetical protein